MSEEEAQAVREVQSFLPRQLEWLESEEPELVASQAALGPAEVLGLWRPYSEALVEALEVPQEP